MKDNKDYLVSMIIRIEAPEGTSMGLKNWMHLIEQDIRDELKRRGLCASEADIQNAKSKSIELEVRVPSKSLGGNVDTKPHKSEEEKPLQDTTLYKVFKYENDKIH